MGKDLLETPYGRFYHLPKLLAARGHEVRVLLLDYKNGEITESETEAGVWKSYPIANYLSAIREEMACGPDWVVGFSDTYFGILAERYAHKAGARACIDAYDNYESYVPWCKPLHWLWRRSLRRADLVTAAGPGLLRLMTDADESRRSSVVPMAADPIGFQPLSRVASRRALKLETDGVYVGYCGSLHRSRGTETLFAAIELLMETRDDIRFFHSGRTFRDVKLPKSLRSLGYLDDALVPVLLNSMNALVVVNRTSSFGQHSHPVKLYEAMACNVPVVASRTLATSWILSEHPERLVAPNDPGALAEGIIRAADGHTPKYDLPAGWDSSCDELERGLSVAVGSESRTG